MSETPDEFLLSIDKFVDDWSEREIKLARDKFAMTALIGVVLMSPVDTGRFRGNWTVSVGAIDRSTTTNMDLTGQGVIGSGTGTINRADAFENIWITNSLPYANRLENGWSKQAPVGMVNVTFSNLMAMVI